LPHSFADIPHEIRRRVTGGERVALLLLDALGLALLHRHDDHPLVRRLRITPLRSQLPSTTTAHVTTMHFGVPVEDHGLYEWNILKPALDAVICPLRFNPAEADGSEGLGGRLDPAALAPGPTFYETLGAPAFVLQPRAIEHSTFTRLATRGAAVHGFEPLSEGLEMLARVLGDVDGPAYAFLYWDAIDRIGHEHGPGSAQFHAAGRAALDAAHAHLDELRDVTVLLCADHGQVDVSPERVDYLDELWPELPTRLSQLRPAGSSRDVFSPRARGTGGGGDPGASGAAGRSRSGGPRGVAVRQDRRPVARAAGRGRRPPRARTSGVAALRDRQRALVARSARRPRGRRDRHVHRRGGRPAFRIEIAYGPLAEPRVGASRSPDRHPGVTVEHTSWLHNALPPGHRRDFPGPT
jgi:hypothetical protein